MKLPACYGLPACFTGISLIWADAGYAGKLVTWAQQTLGLAVQIVRKLAGQEGFQVLPRRWVVERTLAWIAAAVPPATMNGCLPTTPRSSNGP